jgi:hypothetical protein
MRQARGCGVRSGGMRVVDLQGNLLAAPPSRAPRLGGVAWS